MATAGGKTKPSGKVSVPDRDFYIPPVRLDVAPFSKPVGEDVMGWVAALILVGFLLPLLGMLYLDILETKHEVKAQVEKVEKLRRELERKERDDSNNRNPPR
jgi:hypothetical protein